MSNFSSVQKSQLEGAHRIDADYYQLEYLEVRKLVSHGATITLGEISSKFKKGIFDIKADTYADEGVPFIRISNLKNGLIDEAGIAFISSDANEKEKATSLHRGDLVLSKTAYPAASLITADEVNISQDIIGISIKKEWREKILAPFLVAFLNSKYGLAEMQQWFQGNIQMHLSLPDSKKILIPLLPIEIQREVSNLFEESEAEIKKSANFYSQAEKLLLDEIGLTDKIFDEDLATRVRFSEIESAMRMDPDYFQPKYRKLISILNKFEAKPLAELGEKKKGGEKIDPKKQYQYSEISDVNVGDGDAGFNQLQGSELPANAKNKITGGELIISKVRPTRGAIAIIPEDWKEGHIVSGAFSVFSVESPLREYVQVVLRSIVGKLQFEKPTTGTSYPTIEDEDVKNILIPMLPKMTQQKIADLVRQSHEARKKSKQLLEEAKHKVEEMIEKGE